MSGGGKVAIGGGIGAIIVLVLGLLTGKDLSSLLPFLQGDQPVATEQTNGPRAPRPDDSTAQFVSVVLASTEDVWTELFAASGEQYRKPKLRIFDNSTQSACGGASSAMGPFTALPIRKYISIFLFVRSSARNSGRQAILQWPMW